MPGMQEDQAGLHDSAEHGQRKLPVVETCVPRRIEKISFGIMDSVEIVNSAEFQVFQRALYKMPERRPQPNGVLDPRLGISSKRATCETCGQMLADCTGHFGYIKLELPVFHIGYFRSTLQILQCVCKCCARVLLSDNERRVAARKFRNSSMERVRREQLFKKVLDRCKRVRICPHCGEMNGPVKKAPSSLKLIHDQFNKSESAAEEYRKEFGKAAAANEALKANLKSAMDDLNPLRVQGLFKAIPDEDCELLDLAGRPEDLLLTAIPVPPVCIRPSVEMDPGAGSNEDDLTVKLMQIVEVNNILRQGLERGLPISNIAENWDFLQVQCAVYINSDLPGVTSMYQVPGKPTRGFVQRLKGKQGRFRGNLSGKRVDFSGRTVISPDPTLGVEQVGVPKLMAMTLTYPERVTASNISKLKRRVEVGASQHPGANFVEFPSGDKVFLKFGDRQRIANNLKIGDIVERHLEDGDVVLFNRQPSLHRLSIMAHRVKVLEGRTLRFNECVCAPYNADFDGDEMNLHVPQTEEARAEARELLGVASNLSTPKNGEILVAATQDFLTSSYLLSSKDTFLTRPDVCRLASYFLDFNDIGLEFDLPQPTIFKPMELWTGKQIFSLLIRPNVADDTFVTLETKEKLFGSSPSSLSSEPCMDLSDGYVTFRDSTLLCGRLGKTTLGGGNKSGLFQVLCTDYGSGSAVRVMNRLAKLSAKLIGERGFSIGMDDVTPALNLINEKQNAVLRGYAQCQELIEEFQKGDLELAPGCDAVTSLENAVTGELNSIREKAAVACMKTLHASNSPLIMSQCGSKGSPINIAQMVACVGQQSVGGSRAPNGFRERTLPHFERGDRTPEGKGFVANSFYSGLEPTEFFFHTMAGREGLVDTAVKTAETGYMSRRLMKALEDLYVHYDGSVRNAAGSIMQIQYGDDSLDPVAMEGNDGVPIDFDRLFTLASSQKYLDRIANSDDRADGKERTLLPDQLEREIRQEINQHFVKTNHISGEMIPLQDPSMCIKGAIRCSEKFYADLTDFLERLKQKYIVARQIVGLKQNKYGNPELEKLVKPLGFTRSQLQCFMTMCQDRHRNKVVDPGSTVGAFGAQSIGEPGTQMTLKTFHFAGVASMNITLGVPRIKEIINASRNIATPVMLVELEEIKNSGHQGKKIKDAEVRARLIKGRLEKTTLGQISSSIVQKCKSRDAYLDVRLDMEAIESLQLELTAFDMKIKLLEHSKLKLKHNQIVVQANNHLRIHPPTPDDKENTKKKTTDVFLQNIMNIVPNIVVSGIPTISRAVISHPTPGADVQSDLVLYVEGTGMLDVMGTAGVAGTRVKNNNIMEVASVLGIEAARATIIEQIQYTMSQHGMSIDSRHTMLLSDCMTNRGEVLGITRFGIAKMKESVLMLASFEKTTDHLFDAALHGRVDKVTGVSESIIMGIPMPTGTGMFKIVQEPNIQDGGKSQNVTSKVGLLPRRPDPILASY